MNAHEPTTGDSLPPSQTPAGTEQIAGTVYEYPYRVEDFDGTVIRDDLDRVPPFLNQEEMDTLSSVLSDMIGDHEVELSRYQLDILVDVLAKLPDSEWGRDSVPEDLEGSA
jgi:hypothetical protein